MVAKQGVPAKIVGLLAPKRPPVGLHDMREVWYRESCDFM
jgi:hypothetical protein